MTIKKVVFPVGGLGTRFLPATKCIPKEMLPVANKPLIQYAFQEAQDAGIEQFIFITGRNKTAINNHFDHSYELEEVLSAKERSYELELTRGWLPDAGKVVFIRQQHPLGLGHAILCARDVIGDSPFAVILADELLQAKEGCLKQMIASYNKVQANIVAVAPVEKETVSNYGIITPGLEKAGLIEISGMTEKPSIEMAQSNLAIIGRYILEPSIFEYLTKISKGENGELQLTDAMKAMLSDGKSFYAKTFLGSRFDCGTQIGLLEASIAYSLEDKAVSAKTLAMLKKQLKLHEETA